MSYRLIDANALNGVISNDDYEKVLNVPCIFADLPNGLNGDFYDLSVYPKIVENFEQPTVCDIEQIRDEIEQVEINGHIRDVECFRAGINTALNVIDKYRGG